MNVYGIQFSSVKKVTIYKKVKDKVYFGVPHSIQTTTDETKVIFKDINVYILSTGDTFIKSKYITSINRWTFTNLMK